MLVLQQVAGPGRARRVECLSERRLSGKRPQKVQPTCVIIGTQNVQNAATATGATVGVDASKLVKGRKGLVLIDTVGNVLARRVVPAQVSDEAATHPLLEWVQAVMGDSSFAGVFAEHLGHRYGVRFGKLVHIILKKKNLCIHQNRWMVERTLAWLSANRRLAEEYDWLLTRANAWIMWANIRRVLKFCYLKQFLSDCSLPIGQGKGPGQRRRAARCQAIFALLILRILLIFIVLLVNTHLIS